MKFIPPSDLLKIPQAPKILTIFNVHLQQVVMNWLETFANNYEPKLEKITNPDDMVVGEFYILMDESSLHLMYLYDITDLGILIHDPTRRYRFRFVYHTMSRDDIGISIDDELEFWEWSKRGGMDDYTDTWEEIQRWAQVYKLDFGMNDFKIFMNWNKDNPLKLK